MLNELAERLKDPKFIEEFARKEKLKHDNKERRKEKIRMIIHNCNSIELDNRIKSFLKWEEKVEDNHFKNGTLKASNLFNCLLSLFVEEGLSVYDSFVEKNPDKSDFLSDIYEYMGYELAIYVGQGCFYRILKDNECIFQST